ncbi:unnamed protein product [Strongylus vulgaris]|uniref:Uncharacterized protein n=1 Tax=Strongylus vulgaris TaxID=40348 RepID=A0A3P7KJG5_STRVU|nr:unnamed protein product [Strongylus vulgaris]
MQLALHQDQGQLPDPDPHPVLDPLQEEETEVVVEWEDTDAVVSASVFIVFAASKLLDHLKESHTVSCCS